VVPLTRFGFPSKQSPRLTCWNQSACAASTASRILVSIRFINRRRTSSMGTSILNLTWNGSVIRRYYSHSNRQQVLAVSLIRLQPPRFGHPLLNLLKGFLSQRFVTMHRLRSPRSLLVRVVQYQNASVSGTPQSRCLDGQPIARGLRGSTGQAIRVGAAAFA